MRPLPDEHHGTTTCNDADSCAIVRKRVHRIYLASPLHTQAWAKVQTGLSSGLQSHFVGALYRDAVEVPARAARRQWETSHSLHDRVPRLRQMARSWIAVAGV